MMVKDFNTLKLLFVHHRAFGSSSQPSRITTKAQGHEEFAFNQEKPKKWVTPPTQILMMFSFTAVSNRDW